MDEDYWAIIQNSFTVTRGIINLNNGGVSPSPRIVTEETKAEMKRILTEIQDGSFAREWILENKANAPSFKALRRKEPERAK